MKKLYIPENLHGIPEGYYDNNQLVELLRECCYDWQAIYFIADMMEE
jgi:hypothetical protein